MRHRSTSRLLLAVLAALATLVGASAAQAGANFGAAATASATITVISGGSALDLRATGTAAVLDRDSFAAGTASASATGNATVNGDPTALGVGDGVTADSHIQGSASNAIAYAVEMTTGTITLENLSAAATLTVEFSLNIETASATSTGPPGPADALAIAIAFVDGDLVFPPTFHVTLAPGDVKYVDAVVSTQGMASEGVAANPPAENIFEAIVGVRDGMIDEVIPGVRGTTLVKGLKKALESLVAAQQEVLAGQNVKAKQQMIYARNRMSAFVTAVNDLVAKGEMDSSVAAPLLAQAAAAIAAIDGVIASL